MAVDEREAKEPENAEETSDKVLYIRGSSLRSANGIWPTERAALGDAS